MHSVAHRPATSLPETAARRKKIRRLASGDQNPMPSLLLPAYAAHRNQCERDYAAICSRFPDLLTRSVPAAHADAEVFWPSGFITSLQQPVAAAFAHGQRPPQLHPEFQLPPSRVQFQQVATEDNEDVVTDVSSSSAEADDVGRLRRRRRVDAWRLCELLRRRGFGDPRDNRSGPGEAAISGEPVRRGPRIRQVRFHNQESSVSGWFAKRDFAGPRHRRGVSSAWPTLRAQPQPQPQPHPQPSMSMSASNPLQVARSFQQE